MKLKNDKGFVATDISIAIIAMLILIPLMFGMSYNIEKSHKAISRKSYAVNIASDVLEIAKTKQFSEIGLSSGGVLSLGAGYKSISYSDANYIEPGYAYSYYSKKDSEGTGYVVQIGAKKYNSSNVLKILKVRVIYPIGSSYESIDISMPIEKY